MTKTLEVLFTTLHLQNSDTNGVFANGSLLLCPILCGVKYILFQGDLKREGPLIVHVHKEELRWKKEIIREFSWMSSRESLKIAQMRKAISISDI